jgi:hypothetical protein
MIDVGRITNVYSNLITARAELAKATENEIQQRQWLDGNRLTAIASGLIVGKNEAEREAKAREMFDKDYIRLEADECATRQAKLAFDLASIAVEALRMEMRFNEYVVRAEYINAPIPYDNNNDGE